MEMQMHQIVNKKDQHQQIELEIRSDRPSQSSHQIFLFYFIFLVGTPSTVQTGQFHPATNYQGGGNGPLWYNSVLVWKKLIDQSIGMPANGKRYGVDLQFFNVGPVAGGTATIDRISIVIKNITDSVYGHIPFIVAPVYTTDTVTQLVLNHCDTTKKCLGLAPLSAGAANFVCTAPLPADCVTRKRAEGTRRFDYGLGVLFDGSYVLSGHIGLFKSKGAKTAAIYVAPTSFGKAVATQAYETL
jgi:hypothetical protein